MISQYEVRRDLVPSSKALLTPEVQARIVADVRARLSPQQDTLLPDEAPFDLEKIVAQGTAIVVRNTIDIPRISVVPKGDVTTGFEPFRLSLDGLHLQPAEREIVGHMLHTNTQFALAAESAIQEAALEDYVVHALIDYDDIDYDSQADLLYDLAGQVVTHLRSYLSESEARNVLDGQRRLIAQAIHAQMAEHFVERATEYDVVVSRGFTELKPSALTLGAGQAVRDVRATVDDLGRIRQMVFSGFSRCLYPLQKFHSGTERTLALILDRDSERWFRPAKGQFQIYCDGGGRCSGEGVSRGCVVCVRVCLQRRHRSETVAISVGAA